MFRIIFEPSAESRIRKLKKKVASLSGWADYYKREHSRYGMLAYGMDCLETPYKWGCAQQRANNNYARYRNTLHEISVLEKELRELETKPLTAAA